MRNILSIRLSGLLFAFLAGAFLAVPAQAQNYDDDSYTASDSYGAADREVIAPDDEGPGAEGPAGDDSAAAPDDDENNAIDDESDSADRGDDDRSADVAQFYHSEDR